MVSRKEREEQEKTAAEQAAEQEEKNARARKDAVQQSEIDRLEAQAATGPVTTEAKGPRVSTNLDFRPGERLDTTVEDPRLANENTRRNQVEAALSQKQRDTTLYPPTEADIARQQEEAAAKEEASRRDAAIRQFHQNAHTGELGTGIEGLLQVLYRRGLISIPEIEAITGEDIPPVEEAEMEADLDGEIEDAA